MLEQAGEECLLRFGRRAQLRGRVETGQRLDQESVGRREDRHDITVAPLRDKMLRPYFAPCE